MAGGAEPAFRLASVDDDVPEYGISTNVLAPEPATVEAKTKVISPVDELMLSWLTFLVAGNDAAPIARLLCAFAAFSTTNALAFAASTSPSVTRARIA